MKDISQIINLFKSQKPFARLNNRKVFDKFLELLPQNIKNGIDFLFVKNGILFIVLKHQIFKVECQYNKATIKNLLTMIPEIGAQNVEFIVTNKPPSKPQSEVIIQKYKEKSNAIFLNHFENEKLSQIFEQIREVIKAE